MGKEEEEDGNADAGFFWISTAASAPTLPV
jgi:hypothetical protein